MCAARDGGMFLDDVPIHRSLEAAIGSFDGSIDEVVQADDSLGREEVSRLVSYANSRGITYRFVPDRWVQTPRGWVMRPGHWVR